MNHTTTSAPVANHVLHATIAHGTVRLRLECLPGTGHFTADVETWAEADVDRLTADGLIDWDRCWVHDWIEADGTDTLTVGEWPTNGPWPVHCSIEAGAMTVQPAARPFVEVT